MSGNLCVVLLLVFLVLPAQARPPSAEISSNTIRSELPASVEKSGASAFTTNVVRGTQAACPVLAEQDRRRFVNIASHAKASKGLKEALAQICRSQA
jgi:hypothetical protein